MHVRLKPGIDQSGDATLSTNIELRENNARVAAQVARELHSPN